MPELEGVELEREVADRVLGWPVFDKRPSVDKLSHAYPYLYTGYDSDELRICRGYDTSPRKWSPLTSMSDAWEVVTAMAAKGYKHSLLTDSAGCTARFAKEDSLLGDVYSGYALPGNPGEAICRAALSAVNGETK